MLALQTSSTCTRRLKHASTMKVREGGKDGGFLRDRTFQQSSPRMVVAEYILSLVELRWSLVSWTSSAKTSDDAPVGPGRQVKKNISIIDTRRFRCYAQ